MKKQTIILSVLGTVAILALGTLTLWGRGLAKDAYLDDRLKPGELQAVQRDLSRAQWAYARKALASGHLPSFLARMRELAFGRTRSVSRPFDGYVIVQSGYMWSSRSAWVYDLTLSTNGWRY